MIASTLTWTQDNGWSVPLEGISGAVQLAVCFGPSMLLAAADGPAAELRRTLSGAVVASCSTAGEIAGASVSDGGLSVLLVGFARGKVRGAITMVGGPADSSDAGRRIGALLAAQDLRHVLVLSDGLHINGTTLTAGLRAVLPPNVEATGGLAGDGAAFKNTVVGLGTDVGSHRVVGIGFYGASIAVGFGSAGGWMPFGPKRKVTSSSGNVLYTLDDQPALALYKRYLGERAADLPGSGLLFPLQLLAGSAEESGLVRTILAVDEERQSLTFAGDLPAGSFVRLMKAGTDSLVDGARSAAEGPRTAAMGGDRAAFLVSCVGRKLVMGQRVEEEVEAVLGALGAGVHAAGFYSYGEICPTGLVHGCELHNQTMTLTVLGEDS